MKILVIGASGTVGKGIVDELSRYHQVIRVGKARGDFQVDLTSEESVCTLFSRTGKVDAVISATGGDDQRAV